MAEQNVSPRTPWSQMHGTGSNTNPVCANRVSSCRRCWFPLQAWEKGSGVADRMHHRSFTQGKMRAGGPRSQGKRRAGGLCSQGKRRAGGPRSQGKMRAGGLCSQGKMRAGGSRSKGKRRAGGLCSQGKMRAGGPRSQGNRSISQPRAN